MAEPGEVEFMRRVLVGNGLLPAGRLDAWLARWPGDGSFLRHLVEVGTLERSAAGTLTAVMKGYLRLSNEALRGLIGLDAAAPEPGLEDRVPTLRPSATDEVPTPRMQPAEVSTSRGKLRGEASASTSRGAAFDPAAASTSLGMVVDPAAASTTLGSVVDPSASASRRMDAGSTGTRREDDGEVSASRRRDAGSTSTRREDLADPSVSASRRPLEATAILRRPEIAGARRREPDVDSERPDSQRAAEASASTSRGARVDPASASTSRGSTLRGRPTTDSGAVRTRGPRSSPELHAAVDAALAALDDAPTISRASFEPARAEVRTPVPKDRSVAARPFELPAVGDVVAGYQLRKLLGRGASGAVYRAWSPAQPHSVVLKLLRPSDEAPGAAAAAQAAVHWRLRLPGVVTLLAAGEHAGLGYLVFEDLFALSLADYLEVTGPLPASRVAQIGVDVGETLASAAERGIVHGDLKPGNLLVYSSNARVKLTDFAGPSAEAGELRGTPAYLAPELVTGARPADARADMYSLGATLYHAATGRPPFVRQAAVEALRAQVSAVARPVHVVVPDFSRALSGVIARLLHKQPGERYGAWSEVVAALASAEPTIEPGPSDMSEQTGDGRP